MFVAKRNFLDSTTETDKDVDSNLCWSNSLTRITDARRQGLYVKVDITICLYNSILLHCNCYLHIIMIWPLRVIIVLVQGPKHLQLKRLMLISVNQHSDIRPYTICVIALLLVDQA